MEPVVGVFASRSGATGAALALRSHGFPPDRVQLLLSHGAHPEEVVPTEDAEQPGVGQALGGVVGGAAGASAGLGLGAAVASLFIPGVGAVTAVGLAAAALLGAGGAVGGAALGERFEEKTRRGLPKDEAYLYEHVLSHGRSIVFVLPESEDETQAARQILEDAGAESLDAAREAWWVGIRDVEKAHFEAAGGEFDGAEAAYRRGFVAALHPEHRGTTYAARKAALSERHGAAAESEAFRRGYERGLRHGGASAEGRGVESGRPAGGSKPSRPAQT
jgi:hypothetical protein